MNKLYSEANPVSESRNEGYVLPRPLKKGDNVLIVDTNRKGIIITPLTTAECASFRQA